MSHAGLDITIERGEHLHVLVSGVVGEDLHGEDVVRCESWRDALQADEAADQQSGTNEQYERNGEFGDDEQATEAVAFQIKTAIGRPAAAAGFEGRVWIEFDGAPRRSEAEEHAGRERKAECEGQNRAVDSDFIEARNVAGIHGADEHKAEASYEESGDASEEAEKHALRQELPRQAVPACSQCRANGDFLFTSRGASEQKVGDVGTGDQQDERYRPEQHEQWAAYVADYLLLQADDIHAVAGVALVFDTNAAGDDVDIRLGLLHGDPGLEADNDIVVFVAPALCGIGSQGHWEKDVHLVHRSFRGHDLSVEHEATLQHARDSVWLSVKRNGLADDGGVGVEQAHPGAVAENCNGGFAWLVLFR